jgi:hypothetical protein
MVDVSSGEEPPRQQGLALEAPEDMDVPIRALITVHDPDVAVLEGPSALADVPAASPGTQELIMTASLVSPSLTGPSTASVAADLPARETHPAEPTAIPSAIASSFFFWRCDPSGLYRRHSAFGRDAPSGADRSLIGYHHIFFGIGMPYSF